MVFRSERPWCPDSIWRMRMVSAPRQDAPYGKTPRLDADRAVATRRRWRS